MNRVNSMFGNCSDVGIDTELLAFWNSNLVGLGLSFVLALLKLVKTVELVHFKVFQLQTLGDMAECQKSGRRDCKFHGCLSESWFGLFWIACLLLGYRRTNFMILVGGEPLIAMPPCIVFFLDREIMSQTHLRRPPKSSERWVVCP